VHLNRCLGLYGQAAFCFWNPKLSSALITQPTVENSVELEFLVVYAVRCPACTRIHFVDRSAPADRNELANAISTWQLILPTSEAPDHPEAGAELLPLYTCSR